MNPLGDGDPVDPLGAGVDPFDPRALMRRQLFERRTVTLTGHLDDREANEVGAALMTLDATGDDPVQLRMDCSGGTVGAALTLMDIIGLLGVPVRAICVGQSVGPAVGVLAVCHHRQVTPHSRLRLSEPPVEFRGGARQLEQLAASHGDQWHGFCARLAEGTGQPVDRIRRDTADGVFLTAAEAVDYGLADEVATPVNRIVRLPGRPMGFGRR